MASSFDHEDVRFLLVASTQLYGSRALILTVNKSVAKPAKHSAYEMRAVAGLEPDDARRKLIEVALKGQALGLLRSTICPRVKRYNGQGLLADIDADRLLVVALCAIMS